MLKKNNAPKFCWHYLFLFWYKQAITLQNERGNEFTNTKIEP